MKSEEKTFKLNVVKTKYNIKEMKKKEYHNNFP